MIGVLFMMIVLVKIKKRGIKFLFCYAVVSVLVSGVVGVDGITGSTGVCNVTSVDSVIPLLMLLLNILYADFITNV